MAPLVPGLVLVSLTRSPGRFPTLAVLGPGVVLSLAWVVAWAVERSPVVALVEDQRLRDALRAEGVAVSAALVARTLTGRPPLRPVVVGEGTWVVWEGLADFFRPDAAHALVLWGTRGRRGQPRWRRPGDADLVAAAVEAAGGSSRLVRLVRAWRLARILGDVRAPAARRETGRRVLQGLRFRPALHVPAGGPGRVDLTTATARYLNGPGDSQPDGEPGPLSRSFAHYAQITAGRIQGRDEVSR